VNIGKSGGARGIPKLVVKLMACHAEHGSNGNEMAAFFMLVIRDEEIDLLWRIQMDFKHCNTIHWCNIFNEKVCANS